MRILSLVCVWSSEFSIIESHNVNVLEMRKFWLGLGRVWMPQFQIVGALDQNSIGRHKWRGETCNFGTLCSDRKLYRIFDPPSIYPPSGEEGRTWVEWGFGGPELTTWDREKIRSFFELFGPPRLTSGLKNKETIFLWSSSRIRRSKLFGFVLAFLPFTGSSSAPKYYGI
jgi:hypothetical protein